MLHDPDGKPITYHAEVIERGKVLLLEFFAGHEEMKFFEFRELIGSSRKFTTPILMHYDDIGLTFRVGDVRKLR